jgi:hypothetical protein
MAMTVRYAIAQAFDATVQDTDDWTLQGKALAGGSVGQAATATMRGSPGLANFIGFAKTTDNTAATQVLDFTDLGLTFVSQGYRTIRFRSTAVNGTDSWQQTWEQVIWGNDGTTPKLLGTARLIHAVGQINGTVVRYGLVQYHGTTSGATVTDGADVDSGLSLGNFTSGAATLTVPICRNTTTAMRVVGAHFTEDAGTIGDSRLIQVRSATSTTFTVNTFTINGGSEAITSPNGNNNVDITLYLLPPPEVKLVMTSNNLEIHASYNATDNVYHTVEAWVSRQDKLVLAPD